MNTPHAFHRSEIQRLLHVMLRESASDKPLTAIAAHRAAALRYRRQALSTDLSHQMIDPDLTQRRLAPPAHRWPRTTLYGKSQTC